MRQRGRGNSEGNGGERNWYRRVGSEGMEMTQRVPKSSEGDTTVISSF